MSTESHLQPNMPTDIVLSILQNYFGQPISNLQVVQGGHVAQTFSFAVGSQDYIIRFNARMLVNFEKEAYVYENLASPAIPIPRVVHVGRLGDVHFAITEKAPGQNLLQIPRSDYLALIPQHIEMLDAIHQVPVGDRPGYGIFDGNGVAHWASWKAHLEFVSEEEPAGDFYAKWHALFENSFLERSLFEDLYNQMTQLIRYCPEERYLVHGNYGFGNVLTEHGRITAVLDWMHAKYGDFLFDVAWLDFWSPQDGWQDRCLQHYRREQRAVPSYPERILCYECFIALEAMKFYAKGGDRPSYEYAKGRILSLLTAS